MKLSIIIFLASLAFVVTEPLLTNLLTIKTDKDFLLKQKFFLEILHDVHEPLYFIEYLKNSKILIKDQTAYLNWEYVKDFFTYWDNHEFLPRGDIFLIYNKLHLDQVIKLFNFFYYAKDWTTLYKNICWARVHMNEGMFVYALTMTVLHQENLTGIVLPAPYEICPYMFFDSRVINDAYEFKMNYLQNKTYLNTKFPIKIWEDKYFYNHDFVKDNEIFKDYDMWYIWGNYTQDYYYLNEESHLSYLREDIGWNSYYYYFHMDYPFWMDGEEYGLKNDRRGELFLYKHQQFLARYYLERLSQGLGEIPEITFVDPIKYGYDPHMVHYNGQEFTVRKNYYEVYNTESFHDIEFLTDYENHLHDIVDFGFLISANGTKIDLRTPAGVEILGSFLENNNFSYNNRFFGFLDLYVSILLGVSLDMKEDKMPNVMEHFETVTRDSLFYMLYKHLIKIYIDYLNLLPHYTYDELLFGGVEITDVHIDKIETYFKHFDADLTTLMGHNWMFTESGKLLMVRQSRLTYKPFNVHINVTSDKAQKVMVKIFMGPKYDEHGILFTLEENRENFYQLDQFLYDLPLGKSVIKRLSEDFYWNVKDHTTWTELYKRVMLAIDGKMDFTSDKSQAHCGFPNRLLLPKGWSAGMPVQITFVIYGYEDVDYEGFNEKISCGVGSGHRYMDGRPFLYPFDRKIVDFNTFNVPNMRFTDAKIYHLENYEGYHTTY